MDVSSRITAAVSHLAAVSSTPATTQPDQVESPPPPREKSATNTQLSRPGRLISKLSQLRDSAPEQFKQAVSSIASELRSVSEQDSGMGAKMLVNLANELDRAANDAEASAQRPRSSQAKVGDYPSMREGAATPDPSEAGQAAAAEPSPRAPANRAAVDAYRATAAAHDSSVAGPGLARAIESVDVAATGAEPRRP